MKKVVLLFLIFSVLISAAPFQPYVAKVIADENGHILSGENIGLKHPLASLTKMMTMLIVMEKVEKGDFSYETLVTISPKVLKIRGSTVKLKPGEKVTILDLMKAAIINSGNDAAYSLGEFVGNGDIDTFIKLMNEKAKDLGLSNTVFFSPTGLPKVFQTKENSGTDALFQSLDTSTVEDTALLAAEILKHPKYLEISSMETAVIRGGKGNLHSTNKLLGSYAGVDGMKTGYHGTAHYNMVVSAKRDNRRFIIVLFGAASDKIRKDQTTKALDYAFENFEIKTIAKKGDYITDLPVLNGNIKKIPVVLAKDFNIVVNKSTPESLYKVAYLPKSINAPILENEKIGYLDVSVQKNIVGKISLVSSKEVKKLSWFGKLVRFVSFGLL